MSHFLLDQSFQLFTFFLFDGVVMYHAGTTVGQAWNAAATYSQAFIEPLMHRYCVSYIVLTSF